MIWIATLQPVWVKIEFGHTGFNMKLRYLWFEVDPSSGQEPETQHKKPKEPKQRKSSPRKWLKLLPEMLRAAKMSLAYLIKRLLIQNLSIRGTLASEDPSQTGMAFGIYSAFRELVPLPKTAEIEIAPDFENEQSNITGRFEGGIRPSSLISTGILFLWHLPKIKMFKTLRS